MCGFAFTFDDTQQFGVGRQISDDIVRIAALVSLRKEIKAAIHHFHGDGCKRLIERFGDTVGEIHQNRIEQPGCPDLNLNPILSAAPKKARPNKRLTIAYASLRQAPWPGPPGQAGQASMRQRCQYKATRKAAGKRSASNSLLK